MGMTILPRKRGSSLLIGDNQFRWQDLTRDGRVQPACLKRLGALAAGRGWFVRHPGDDDRYRNLFGLEWYLGWRHPAWSFSQDDEDGTLALWFGIGHCYVSRDQWRRDYRKGDRDFSIRIFDGGIWWTLWMSDNEWKSTDPRWRRGSWRPLDTLLGKRDYLGGIVVDEDTRPLVISDTESYNVRVKLSNDVWRRPRWPFLAVVKRAHYDVQETSGLPIPGKGENAWDIDDDAIFGGTMAARSIHECLKRVREDVLKTRERHGGKNWTPAA